MASVLAKSPEQHTQQHVQGNRLPVDGVLKIREF